MGHHNFLTVGDELRRVEYRGRRPTRIRVSEKLYDALREEVGFALDGMLDSDGLEVPLEVDDTLKLHQFVIDSEERTVEDELE